MSAIIKESKVPKCLVEILVYGIQENKEAIDRMNANIQDQLANHKKGKLGRLLWYVDKGEKTVEEKKNWLIENSHSRYQIFVPENYVVGKDYIKTIFSKIKKLDDSFISAKQFGLTFHNNDKKHEKLQSISEVN